MFRLFKRKKAPVVSGNSLADYYTNYNEDGRLLTPYGRVEFLTTVRYIEKYLRPGMRVIEIGAGTGRYSHYFAQKGYPVTAVELVEHNLSILKSKTIKGEDLIAVQGNAVDLSRFANGSFDVTLLLGPMYHLYRREAQNAALCEAIRVTKPGGVVFVAYCMADPSILGYGFIRHNALQLVRDEMLDPETFQTFSEGKSMFQLYTVADIRALVRDLPVTELGLVAADGYANHMRKTVDEMSKAEYDLYLRYHFATCERQDLIGLSHHTLQILRKNETEG